MAMAVHALDALSIAYKLLGLKVSWVKTKIQNFVALFDVDKDLPPPVAVHGDHVSFCDSFMYIGSAIGSG